MHATGDYSISDLADLSSVSRPTVYRTLNRRHSPQRTILPPTGIDPYIRDELGFTGARQGAILEKETLDLATGEVSWERWYLLFSLSSRRCPPKSYFE